MKIQIRIYYEDTDCGGVVYYANYLKYFERGRTELLRDLGVPLPELIEKGFAFVVRRAEADYLSPCRYDDLLTVETRISAVSRVTITFEHAIKKNGSDAYAVRGIAVLALVGKDGRPAAIPPEVKKILENSLKI